MYTLITLVKKQGVHLSYILIKTVPSIRLCRDSCVYTIHFGVCVSFQSPLETITTHLSHQVSQKFILNLLTNNNCSSATFSHTGNTFGATLHNSRPSATKAKATNSPLEADAKYVPA